MKYILSIAVAVLFCLPTVADAKPYRLSEKTAKKAAFDKVVVAEIAWKINNDAIEMPTEHINCQKALSRTKRLCYAFIRDEGSLVCTMDIVVEARKHRNYHILVTRTRSNDCEG